MSVEYWSLSNRFRELQSAYLTLEDEYKELKREHFYSKYNRTEIVVNEMKVLNNLVTELLNVKVPVSPLYREYNFTNPRDGWIFISSTADIMGSGRVRVALDSASAEEALIVHEAGKEQTLEAMRLLSAGEHKLKVWCEGESSLELIVRAIPELIYNSFPSNPHVSEYGPYDKKFLEKDVLRNVNVIVGSLYPVFTDEWKKQGKRWITEASIYPVIEETVTAEAAYNYWAGQEGFQNPSLDGIIVDAFPMGNFRQYEAWIEAVKRIHQSEKFKGKTFYGYVETMHLYSSSKEFIQTLMDLGYKFAWDTYFRELPTEGMARDLSENRTPWIYSPLKSAMLAWRKVQPGVEKHMILNLNYESAPPESMDANPGVDYKVFMDIQLNEIANDPAF
ncbi:MAG: hypothetical protein QXF26_08105 [Candidatus Bathyarchaeia archaeon]